MRSRFFLGAVLAAVAAMPAAARAQAMPDLTGTWTIDAAKSDPAPLAVGRGRGNPNQMVVTRGDTTLTVSIGGANYIYNLDGSERTGPPGGETKSTIAWKDGTLIVTWKREFYDGPDKGYITSNGRDTYALTGNVLTVERMSTVPPEPAKTRKTVYNKAP